MDEGRLTQKPRICRAKVQSAPRFLKTYGKRVFGCKVWFIVILSKVYPIGRGVHPRTHDHK